MPTQMTDQEILQKAIEKAVKNGYILKDDYGEAMNIDDLDEETYKLSVKDKSYYIIIFSHDFAKSFWGDKNTDYAISCMGINRMPFLVSWQYHLTQMVLEPDPIKYLEKYL